jgi:hypothetical protein
MPSRLAIVLVVSLPQMAGAYAQTTPATFMIRISFGSASYALSASPLSHAERPLGLAFLLYPDFSWGVQRNRTTAVAGSLMGGLPRRGLS